MVAALVPRSRDVAFPAGTGERAAGFIDVARIDAGVSGKFYQQRLVPGDMFQDAGQEPRLLRGGPDVGRSDAGEGEKPAQPLRVLSEQGESLNRKQIRALLRVFGLVRHQKTFAFP